MAQQEAAAGRTIAAMQGIPEGGRIARAEGRHRAEIGGVLRATVFGINDGLVSNFSLVMGVAGGTTNNSIVLLAGIAGLVAGAFSMSSGEWISIRSQRELYENELRIEQAELRAFPAEERDELEMIYRAKGIAPEAARTLVDTIMKRNDIALDTLAREELGLNPEELGSPWGAAISSFVSFSAGALLPLMPFFLAAGAKALPIAIAITAVSLFSVGALLSLFTGRNSLYSGARMLLLGAIAGGVTYTIGRLAGVALG
jgi:VIT1/CCC1 family predicted Fe2+/Mn2+ transporter